MGPKREPLDPAEVARELRAVILLAGRVGRNPFADGVARSVLDMPVRGDQSVLGLWTEQLKSFAAAFDLPGLDVVLAVDRTAALPRVRPAEGNSRLTFRIARDPVEYRGTAGVVKDLTRGFGDEARVLVVTANQLQREPLHDVFRALAAADEGVAVVSHAGSDLATMFLLRCARLRDVADVGFVDLKEQAIPSGRAHGALGVARRPADSSIPIRTLAEYIKGLRLVHSAEYPRASSDDAFSESWKPVFSIVEEGAFVSTAAELQDSVVLAGGVVESGATVARSVVCEGGVVTEGQFTVESIVTTKP